MSSSTEQEFFIIHYQINMKLKIEHDTHKCNHNIKSKKAKIGKRLRNDCFSCQVRNETNTDYVISDTNNKQLISVETNLVDGKTQTTLKTNYTLRNKEIVIDRNFSIFDFVGTLIEFEVINIDCQIDNGNFKKMIKELDK